MERIEALNSLHTQQRSLGWGLGAAQNDHMSKRAATQALMQLYQLLLFTMPGTPVFTYGDEIGLRSKTVSVSRVQSQMFVVFFFLQLLKLCSTYLFFVY